MALCMSISANAAAPKNAAVVRRNDKVLRVPLGSKAHGKRANEESSSEPSSTTPSRASSKETSTPAATSSSDSEEGPLEADKSDENASDNNSADNHDNGSVNESNADVVTDAQGNPIVTNLDVSYWEMITPSGVLYASGASRAVSGAAAAGVALFAAAMF
ncbi:hypothetical protein IW140_001083 [Coemansia sp. RSA 1813]|nr:hypothetical protein EV178_002310 [Coemansia sp. RSA 1646]KAJ1773116.1 hypothetical protein LPJ74_000855 [Coemansia sp. RSA 1843]KAJ2091993.1 hypothetical protein IW138_001359 [Coemansia sp. RSA 986]KAJ2216670.1 hypothetical protein EV179_001209 [Coemansia sp. RSA 487]KAJ2572043.1 hypothetical protein IW140_001083 [Coemansia sp. RSA 1813]